MMICTEVRVDVLGIKRSGSPSCGVMILLPRYGGYGPMNRNSDKAAGGGEEELVPVECQLASLYGVKLPASGPRPFSLRSERIRLLLLYLITLCLDIQREWNVGTFTNSTPSGEYEKVGRYLSFYIFIQDMVFSSD
jgi:hypothetical protein